MIGFGCVLSFCLFGTLVCSGSVIASRSGISQWIGLGSGLAAWLTVMSGYVAALTIADWWVRDRYPQRRPTPIRVVVGIWTAFLAMAFITVALGKRLYPF